MIPAARISAAIEIIDRILKGAVLDQALKNWGRGNRFAGSGDRAAIRDLVFDAWRCRRSYAALGGAETGRGLMIGRLRATDIDPATLFTGIGHAPAALSATDAPRPATEAEALDCPDWLFARFGQSLGDELAPVLQAMQRRAPVFLRVNLARCTREAAIDSLRAEGIDATPNGLAASALEVSGSTRKILTTNIFLSGLVELQDAASQAVIAALPLSNGQSALDYCAGGGGKALALAARGDLHVWAHDVDPARMRDLPARAKRAGANVRLLTNPADHAPYDLVLVDAPCSGSGSWRRDPAGKWALTEARLDELTRIQAEILGKAAALVGRDGRLAYVTCSLLAEENHAQIRDFLKKNTDWQQIEDSQYTPLQGGDGFYLSVLNRKFRNNRQVEGVFSSVLSPN